MPEPTLSGATLRPARPEDLAPVLALLRDSDLPIEGVGDAFDRFVVASAEGEIVGVAGLEVYGSAGLLRSVAVAGGWRGRGLGGALTEEVMRAAGRAGVEEVYLLTETAEDFFPRHGFRRIPREDAAASVQASVEFARLCPSSSAVMVRPVR